ncbi:MAG: 50S ribosomal protein L24 [Parcubacteria group bacterium]|nr:MAG: 50S ribosomal protein L24 [Parcubacteria group bacterium]
MNKYKIKVNDKVAVSSGKDKGKTGKVLQILPDMKKLVVEGINVMYKHMRPQKKGEKGQRVQFNGPIAISNVILVCPKCGRNSRVGMRLASSATNKKIKERFCRKCKEIID